MRNVIASNGRFRFVVFGIVFCFLAVVARLAWLQLIAPEKYIKSIYSLRTDKCGDIAFTGRAVHAPAEMENNGLLCPTP